MTSPQESSPSVLGPLSDLLAATRRNLASSEVEATAGGGAVRVTMDGERRPRSISIDPAAMAAGPEGLAELILAALSEAWERAKAGKSSAIDSLIHGAVGLR